MIKLKQIFKKKKLKKYYGPLIRADVTKTGLITRYIQVDNLAKPHKTQLISFLMDIVEDLGKEVEEDGKEGS